MMSSAKPVALITGASSGMGRDFALRLIREGYDVYGAARRLDHMRDIEAAGGVAIARDVTDENALAQAVDTVIARSGRIDVVVNNAGYGQYGAVEDVPLALARRQFEVNLFGAARLTQLCLPHMRARRGGTIINISSIGGKIATPLGGSYHASKFALEGWSDSLRNEVRAFGIRVVIIEPGGIASEWNGIAAAESERLSGRGVYAELVAGAKRAQAKMKAAPPPTVISDLVVRSVRSKRPRARYSAGLMARPILMLRRVLSGRFFDALIMNALR